MELNELKILICDDSILARKKMKDIIEEIGCSKIFEAIDGNQAIDIYKEQKPHLVFMDIVMPIKTGIDALKEIINFDQHAKVVIVSSIGTNEKLKDAIKIGAYDFYQKPIDKSKISKTIFNFINKHN